MHFRSMVALALLLVGVSAVALAAPRPSAIPSHPALNHLMLFPHEDLILLLELLENADENAERLLASDDPADIGLGIFVASYSSDLDRLLAARDLLFDDRETLPIARFADSSDARKMGVSSRTVGQHLARTYIVLFGLDDGRLTKATDIHAEVARIAQEGSAWEYASAWRHRYLVAMTDDDRKFILNEIRNLPDDTNPLFFTNISRRWASLPSAARSGVVDEIIATPNETLRLFVARYVYGWGYGEDRTDHCDRILSSLSPATRQAIQTRSLEFPPDQIFQRIHHSYYGGGIYGWYESVTSRAE